MKLSGPEATRFVGSPDLSLCGALIYGADGSEVALRGKRLIKTIMASEGEADDLRLTRISGADARRDKGVVLDAIRAQGFFGGRPIVLVEEATDGATAALEAALSSATGEDGFLIATAGTLPARSKLRALFEKARNAVAAPVYDDLPGEREISAWLQEERASEIGADAVEALAALGRKMDRGTLRDLVRRLALYAIDLERPATADDVAGLSPLSEDEGMDDAVSAIFDGEAGKVGAIVSRLLAQGQTPVSIVLACQRQARRIHQVLALEGSPDAAISSLRPPAYGAQKQRLIRQCRTWRLDWIEGALKLLLETDNGLRGASAANGGALVERAALRIALSVRSR